MYLLKILMLSKIEEYECRHRYSRYASAITQKLGLVGCIYFCLRIVKRGLYVLIIQIKTINSENEPSPYILKGRSVNLN